MSAMIAIALAFSAALPAAIATHPLPPTGDNPAACPVGDVDVHDYNVPTGVDMNVFVFGGATGFSVGITAVSDNCEDPTALDGDGEYEFGVGGAWLHDDHHSDNAGVEPYPVGDAVFTVGSDGDNDGFVSPDFNVSLGPDYLSFPVNTPNRYDVFPDRGCYSYSDPFLPGDNLVGTGEIPAGYGPLENDVSDPAWNTSQFGWWVFVSMGLVADLDPVPPTVGVGNGAAGHVRAPLPTSSTGTHDCGTFTPPIPLPAFRRAVVVRDDPASPPVVLAAAGTCTEAGEVVTCETAIGTGFSCFSTTAMTIAFGGKVTTTSDCTPYGANVATAMVVGPNVAFDIKAPQFETFDWKATFDFTGGATGIGIASVNP